MPCGHIAHAHQSRLCRHLLGEADHDDYVQRLLGRGLASDYVCRECDRLEATDLLAACEGCVGRATRYEAGTVRGWATVQQRVAAISMERRGSLDVELPFSGGVAPCRDGWLTLGYGFVVSHHGPAGSRQVCTLPGLPDETAGEAATKAEFVLQCARDGSAVALVRDYGRYGVVASTVTGRTIVELDGADTGWISPGFPAPSPSTWVNRFCWLARIGTASMLSQCRAAGC